MPDPSPDPHSGVEDVAELYRAYAGRCLAHARRVLRDEQMAEDAVQEAFTDAWLKADDFDRGLSTPSSWLLMLTHRRAVDRVRREQRRHHLCWSAELIGDLTDPLPGPEEQACRTLAGEQTRVALRTLPESQREAIVLAYWGGLTQRQIAELTETPLGTVKTRMLAGMKRLAIVLPSTVEQTASSH